MARPLVRPVLLLAALLLGGAGAEEIQLRQDAGFASFLDASPESGGEEEEEADCTLFDGYVSVKRIHRTSSCDYYEGQRNDDSRRVIIRGQPSSDALLEEGMSAECSVMENLRTSLGSISDKSTPTGVASPRLLECVQSAKDTNGNMFIAYNHPGVPLDQAYGEVNKGKATFLEWIMMELLHTVSFLQQVGAAHGAISREHVFVSSDAKPVVTLSNFEHAAVAKPWFADDVIGIASVVLRSACNMPTLPDVFKPGMKNDDSFISRNIDEACRGQIVDFHIGSRLRHLVVNMLKRDHNSSSELLQEYFDEERIGTLRRRAERRNWPEVAKALVLKGSPSSLISDAVDSDTIQQPDRFPTFEGVIF